MELEESAKAALQSNSGAEPEDHYFAQIYRLGNELTNMCVEIQR